MKIIKIGFLFMSLALIAGCATMFNSNEQIVAVHTSTNKKISAEIKIPDSSPYQSDIPNIFYVEPSSFEEFSISVDDPCFEPVSVTVDKSLTSVFWLNIFNYFVIGLPVDYFSGNMWNYENQVTVPLALSNVTDQACESHKLAVETPAERHIPSPKARKHRISTGFGSKVHSQRYEDTDNSSFGIGPYLEYSYLLNSEFMVNGRIQFAGESDYYYNECSGLEARGVCTNEEIRTTNNLLAVSLRHFLSPTSGFYAGLGMAQVNVDQTYSDYSSNEFSSFNTTDLYATTHAVFLDFGWQARKGKVSVNINGMMDLAELRLTSPDFEFDGNDLNIYGNRSIRRHAINSFRNASLVSNVSLGFTVAF